jgi:cytochrome c oxidase subunit 4
MSTETAQHSTAPTASTAAHHAEADEGHAHGATDKQYIIVAVCLAAITALEVYSSYADWLGKAFVPLLLVMMAIKFWTVAAFFMHLRFDNRIFTWLFYAGLFLAVGVYVATLATFKFFNP